MTAKKIGDVVSDVQSQTTRQDGFTDPAPAETTPVPAAPQGATLTTEEFIDPNPMEQNVTVVEGERGGIAWCHLYGLWVDKDSENKTPHLVDISITDRAENSWDALQQMLKTLSQAKAMHLYPWQPDFSASLPKNPPAQPKRETDPTGLPVTTVQPPAPAQPAGAPPVPASAPAAPRTPAPRPPVQSQPAQPKGGLLNVVKVEIKPRGDGTTQVDLFGAGRKFADLHLYGDPEALADRFGAGWQPEHFETPASYNVALKVNWVESEKLNSKGNPYKDVTDIFPG